MPSASRAMPSVCTRRDGASNNRGRPPLRIRGSLFVDDWMWSAGFLWGLSNEPDAFPKKEPQCFALLLERYDPSEPVMLKLKQLLIGEFIPGVPYVKHSSTFAQTPVKDPLNHFLAVEIVLHETGMEVWIDGELFWKPQVHDRKVFQELLSAEGAVGVAGRGKTVTFREATVMFLDLKKRKN